jgi:5'-3' exonuclease
MVALGNDFLPYGFALKLREDGHDRLLNGLEYFTAKKQSFFTDNINGRINYSDRSGLSFFLKGLANDEEARIENFIKRKKTQSGNIGDQTALGQKNWPMAAFLHEESHFLSPNGKLVPDWKTLYLKKYFHGATIEQICEQYLIGLQWVWDYYTGRADQRPDKWSWYYPWHMPPLWCWLQQYLITYEDSRLKLSGENGQPPLPIQQLTMVLPPESYELIPDKSYRNFYQVAPWYFPSRFRFFSAGRRFFWECEADIPIVSLNELKAYLDKK